MFGGWAHLAAPPEDLTEKERSPPPEPTRVEFPSYIPQEPPRPRTSASSRDLYNLLYSIRKPQDITPEYLRPLNLKVTQNVSFQDLLPPTGDSPDHVPKSTTPQDRLQQTIQELQTPHTDAFREVVRLPPIPGRPRARLSQTRKFWTGLEKMSQYWDCRMDQFYEIPDPKEEQEAAVKSNPPNSDQDVEMSNTHTHPIEPSNPTTTKRPTTKQVYKGRRIGTGSSMPPSHRDEAVSGLIESVVWPYNCQVRSPSLAPRLSVQNLLFPVRQSFIVGRVPREREAARRSVLEGPIMGICCRGDTKFHEEASQGRTDHQEGEMEGVEGDGVKKDISWREILDLAREIAVMLLLAQERAREGKEETKPGEGKWWTTKPRWGGGPGGPVVEDDDDSIPVASSESSSGGEALPPPTASETASPNLETERPPQKRKANTDISRGKMTQLEKWKILRPGPGIWDRRMKYMRIGAPVANPNSAAEAEDPIFLITSLNHHIALLKLDVSEAWLEWLAGRAEGEGEVVGRPEAGAEAGSKNSERQDELPIPILHLQRTRWFDLFDEGDRVEFVRGLAGIMGWLMR